MEEVIKQIKDAEVKAAALISDARKEAETIATELESELDRMRDTYDEKLKTDSLAVLNAAKARINQLTASETENAQAKANKIRMDARAKVKPCADFVYDTLIKEFTE